MDPTFSFIPMRKLFTLIFTFTSVFAALPSVAHACSCMARPASEAFAEGNVVFQGKVIGIEEDTANHNKKVAFSVESVWAGPAINGFVVTTPFDSAGCGIEFQIGEKPIVVARMEDEQINANLCGQYYVDEETGDTVDLEEVVHHKAPLFISSEVSCVPYVCRDGSVHASCTADGHQIMYFAEPCHTHGGEGLDTFSDVPSSHVHAEAITWAKNNGIVEGYADGTFRPDTTVNRAEFTKILIEAYEMDTEALCKIANFPDAPMSEWFGKYIQSARCSGVISGYPDGTFKPSASINFAEAAKIVANLDSGTTIDASGSPWYQVYIDYLVEKEAAPALNPSKLITRGEMVEIMFRLISQ